MSHLSTDYSYQSLLSEVKKLIKLAQIKAVVAVNQELLMLHWLIGNLILVKQKENGWGNNVIGQLSKDLKLAFPEMKGFSERNLGYMKKLTSEYTQIEILQVPLAKLSWYQNITLVEKIEDKNIRIWYALKTLENGWSRDMMVMQIETKLHLRQGNSINNFEQTLPKPQSELAQQMLKDPFLFDFLNLTETALERELEDALVKQIVPFLLELGQGFAFVGRQYVINIDNEDYKIDLLFYHLRLRCYVIIDLKIRKFMPEDAGKMNFYINAFDDIVKGQEDNPTIGIILCKDKNSVKAEYALRGIKTPIGISEFRLTEILPDEFKSSLPSIEELEQKLRAID